MVDSVAGHSELATPGRREAFEHAVETVNVLSRDWTVEFGANKCSMVGVDALPDACGRLRCMQMHEPGVG